MQAVEWLQVRGPDCPNRGDLDHVSGKMKETAEAYVGEKANDVVVTVVARTLTTALWTSATGLEAQES